MSFPPFILPRLTVVWPHADAAVQSVVEPCNIAVYLHSKNPYLHSISHVLCNKLMYTQTHGPGPEKEVSRTPDGAGTFGPTPPGGRGTCWPPACWCAEEHTAPPRRESGSRTGKSPRSCSERTHNTAQWSSERLLLTPPFEDGFTFRITVENRNKE